MKNILDLVKNRVNTLKNYLISNDYNSILVTDPQNLFYLTNYQNEDAFILITQENGYYFTDLRYFEDVKNRLKNLDVICLNNNFKLDSFLLSLDIHDICFEKHHMTYGRLERIKKTNESMKFTPIDSPILNFRHIKDEYEIKQIEKSCEISKYAYESLCRNFTRFKTEVDISYEYEKIVREMRASFVSFEPIIANGEGSSIPHYKSSIKKIDYSKLTLLDLGCIYNGYCSDMTRVILPMKVSKKVAEIYKIVEEAKNIAINEVKPFVNVRDIDQKVKLFFRKFGYEENFTHSLGHSVGLSVHDGLVLSDKSDFVLEENMVITIEPGLYFENLFGIRNEDTVLVNTNGFKILT